MNKNIAVIRGDGIGPEIVAQAIKVLDKIAEIYGHTFNYTEVDMGGCAIDKWGDPLPKEMLEKCLASDSVLLGAVGGNKERRPRRETPGERFIAPALRHGCLQQQSARQKSGRSWRVRRP